MINFSMGGGFDPANAGAITGTTITGTVAVVGGAGSASLPGLYLSTDTTTGWYRRAANFWTYTNQTNPQLDIGANDWIYGSGQRIQWTSNASAVAGTSDLFLTRSAPAIFMISGDGTGTASGQTGWKLGNDGTVYSAIWPSQLTPSASNFSMRSDNGGNLMLNVASTSNQIAIAIANSSVKFTQDGTAGAGPSITAGTAASAVSALSVTQTRNFSSSATDYLSAAFTETSVHASDNYLALYGGAGGVTLKFNIKSSGVPNVQSGGSTTISTGVGSVKMSTANAATNTAWIPLSYAGTTYFVPAYTTNAP